MIWIIGGTTEGAKMSADLKGYPHIVTLGTKEGMDYYKGSNFMYKRMGYEEMLDFIREENISLIIDLTHPFAVEVSDNARKAAEEMKIQYFRYERPTVKKGQEVHIFKNYEECLLALKDTIGTALITTGVNKISEFEKIKGNNRFIYRILPTIESIGKCRELGIHSTDIVAMVGPFTKDLNKSMISFYGAKRIVMKDSGATGGTEEKLQAAEEMGIEAFLIEREDSNGETWEEFKEKILKELNN